MPHRAAIVGVAWVDGVPLFRILALRNTEFVGLAASPGALAVGFFFDGRLPRLYDAPHFFPGTVACGSVSVSHMFTVEQEASEGNRLNQTTRCFLFFFTFDDPKVEQPARPNLSQIFVFCGLTAEKLTA